MLRLNFQTSRRFTDYEVHAVTDITGYGLAGHAYEMATGSQVTLELEVETIPVLEGVRELARQGVLPGGIKANRRYVADAAEWSEVEEGDLQILFDPQTSGGLLVSLPAADAGDLSAQVCAAGGMAARIGHVSEYDGKHLRIK
jgi:selenide,water dikinase